MVPLISSDGLAFGDTALGDRGSMEPPGAADEPICTGGEKTTTSGVSWQSGVPLLLVPMVHVGAPKLFDWTPVDDDAHKVSGRDLFK